MVEEEFKCWFNMNLIPSFFIGIKQFLHWFVVPDNKKVNSIGKGFGNGSSVFGFYYTLKLNHVMDWIFDNGEI